MPCEKRGLKSDNKAKNPEIAKEEESKSPDNSEKYYE